MDIAAVSGLVDELVTAVQNARDELSNRWRDSLDDYNAHRDDVLRLVPAAQRIAAAVANGPAAEDFELTDDGWEFSRTYDAALRLQGVLRTQATIDKAMASDGPTLAAERLHPWVWEAAASLWRDGHHRNAIHAAAAQIENRLQAKIGREDVSGAKLAREAFTLNAPAVSKPRLRFTWLTVGSEAYTSAHEGAMEIGAGCMQLIRNTAAHRPTKLSETVALEHLACLSLFSRLIDYGTVQRAAGDVAMIEGPERPFG
jgi:uncharacterized protein (TIGR02391 family)